MRRRLSGASFVLCAIVGGCAPGAQSPDREIAGLELQAERGNAVAANNLGMLYAYGTKIPQDFGQAKKWLMFASEHGNAAGEFNLGMLYFTGKGTPVDINESLRWIRAAADHDYAPAKLQLGLAYGQGKGVPQDDGEALRWIRAAAVQGFGIAQFALAVMYASGSAGEADDGLAYEWASLAAVHLPPQAQPLATKLRDESAKYLSPEIIATAQAATTQWKPGIDETSPYPLGSGPRPTRVRSQGSGFIIGKNGEVATDHHVIPNCHEIRLKDSSGKFDVVSHVIADDKINDLAILSGGGFGARLKLKPGDAAVGESIVTYGYPLGTLLSSGGNLTNGSVSGANGLEGSDKTFQISAPVQPGSSGGPVVDQSGAVVGIVVGQLNAVTLAAATGNFTQNVNFATHSRLLQALMDAKGIAYETAGPGGARTNMELADELQKATVKVECSR
jgi:S1-C subfamily serine protease